MVFLHQLLLVANIRRNRVVPEPAFRVRPVFEFADAGLANWSERRVVGGRALATAFAITFKEAMELARVSPAGGG